VRYCDERKPERNADMIFAALAPFRSKMVRVHDLTLKVAESHHGRPPHVEA
jgi:hypothetical protein